MTLVLPAHVLAAMQQSYKKPKKFSTLTFTSVCMSNMPARESILQANVYQEILVWYSFRVKRMNFAEQHALV